MDKFLVELLDDSQCQDREDSTYVLTVEADTEEDACELALRDEPANVYVVSVKPYAQIFVQQ